RRLRQVCGAPGGSKARPRRHHESPSPRWLRLIRLSRTLQTGTSMHHLSIPEAIAEIRDGKFIIVVDDEGRENEGDLVMAAQCVTPEAVNFMTRYGRGLICVPTTGERLDALELPLMVPQSENSSGF